MKRIFLFLIVLILLLTTNSYSQNSLEDLFPNKDLTRDLTYLPLTEVDSIYDNVSGTWSYFQDVAHLYYTGICKDSITTESQYGVPTTRDLYQWDPSGVHQLEDLSQLWNGSSWDNYLKQELVMQTQCFYDHIFTWLWNGVSWDTAVATKEILTLNSFENPTLRTYYKYVNSQWKLSRQVYDYYDSIQHLSGEENYFYSTTTGNLTSASRDTSYEWFYFNSYCDFQTHSHETLYLDTAGTWVPTNKSIFFILPNEGYDHVTLNWNGTSYDSSSKSIFVNDIQGNTTSMTLQSYDSINQNWVTYYETQYVYTYGSNNEIVKTEYSSSDCAVNYDTLAPCWLHHYSNFISCDIATAEIEPEQQNKNLIQFSPNPFSEKTTLYFNDAGDSNGKFSLIIYDLYGREVKKVASLNSKVTIIDRDHLVSGIYFYSLFESGKVIASGKVVVD